MAAWVLIVVECRTPPCARPETTASDRCRRCRPSRYAAARKRLAKFIEGSAKEPLPDPDATPEEVDPLAVTVAPALDSRKVLARQRRIADAIVQRLIPTRPGGPGGSDWPTPLIP